MNYRGIRTLVFAARYRMHDAGHVCGQCLQEPPVFQNALCAFRYEQPVAGLLNRFKHNGKLACGHWLAHALADAIARTIKRKKYCCRIVLCLCHYTGNVCGIVALIRAWKLAKCCEKISTCRYQTRCIVSALPTASRAGSCAATKQSCGCICIAKTVVRLQQYGVGG
jgi:hypothetical protein